MHNVKGAKATISDVALYANTGKTSVSRYLNGEQHRLSPHLRLRIEQAITALNYRPSQMARGLKKGTSRLIGLILADITNTYSVDVMRGIEAACRQYGFTLLVCNTNNEVEQEQHYLELLLSYQVDGIIINAVGMREEGLSKLHQSGLPTIFIDRKIADYGVDIVKLDNHQSTEIATRHLVDRHFTALLFLSEPLGCIHPRLERLHAFRILTNHYSHLQVQHAEVSLGDHATLATVLRDFYQNYPQQKKAIMVANGALLLQVALALRNQGLVWGKDLGLLGFDDAPWTELAGCGITTLRQPTYEIGFSALELLFHRIQKPDNPVQELKFPGELVIRASTDYDA